MAMSIARREKKRVGIAHAVAAVGVAVLSVALVASSRPEVVPFVSEGDAGAVLFVSVTGGALAIGGLVASVVGTRRVYSALVDLEESAINEKMPSPEDVEHPAAEPIAAQFEEYETQVEQLADEAVELRQQSDAVALHTKNFAETVDRIKTGELDARLNEPSDPELAEFANTFNEMVEELGATLARAQLLTEEVSEHTVGVQTEINSVREANVQLAEDIEATVEQLEEQLDAVSKEVQSVSVMSKEVAESSNKAAELAQQTADAGLKGREAAQSALADLREMKETTEELLRKAQSVSDVNEEIRDFTDTINEIASRTNMLALNAQIEVSRGTGGELEQSQPTGRAETGFNVVADEIEALSSEAKGAAADIQTRVDRITTEIEEVTAAAERSESVVASHAESMGETIDVLTEVSEKADETNRSVQNIRRATDEQAAVSTEVVNLIDDAESALSIGADGKGDIGASVRLQTKLINSIGSEADQLADRVTRLNESLNSFRSGDAHERDLSGIGDADAPTPTVFDAEHESARDVSMTERVNADLTADSSVFDTESGDTSASSPASSDKGTDGDDRENEAGK